MRSNSMVNRSCMMMCKGSMMYRGNMVYRSSMVGMTISGSMAYMVYGSWLVVGVAVGGGSMGSGMCQGVMVSHMVRSMWCRGNVGGFLYVNVISVMWETHNGFGTFLKSYVL